MAPDWPDQGPVGRSCADGLDDDADGSIDCDDSDCSDACSAQETASPMVGHSAFRTGLQCGKLILATAKISLCSYSLDPEISDE